MVYDQSFSFPQFDIGPGSQSHHSRTTAIFTVLQLLVLKGMTPNLKLHILSSVWLPLMAINVHKYIGPPFLNNNWERTGGLTVRLNII